MTSSVPAERSLWNLAVADARPSIFGNVLAQFGDSRERLADSVSGTARAAREAAESAGERIAEVIESVKPRLRGVSHMWAFFFFLIAGTVLIILAGPGLPRVAIGIYVLGLLGLFGVSAVYHRVDWKKPSTRQWMRRLDHTMILVFIAATYTPFALLVLNGSLATALLIALWAIAAAGVLFNLLWIRAPKVLRTVVYVLVGVAATIPLPRIADDLGVGGFSLILLGGALYICGAVVYAAKRPNPRPGVFGYHEVFHLLVIAAAALQFAAIAGFVLPSA